MVNAIDGYIVGYEHSDTIEGSRGETSQYPAMSKEFAEEYIKKHILPNAGAILNLISDARFIELPGGKLHDNRTGKTYESYDDYSRQLFLPKLSSSV